MFSKLKKSACGCFKPPVKGNGDDGDDNNDRRKSGGEAGAASTGKQPMEMEIDEFEEHPLMWSRALDEHILGQFSFAVFQANEPIEDASQVEVCDNGTFVGVYDGHGGVDASYYVVNNLFNNLVDLLLANNRNMTEDLIRQAVAATEQGFLDVVTGVYEKDHDNAARGSCCLIGVIWGDTLYLANLGDSRAVMGCKRLNDMVPEQLNEEHNVRHVLIREELRRRFRNDPRILDDSRGVWRIKNLIQISKSIGDFYLKNPALPAANDKYRPNTPITEAVLSSDPTMYTRRLERTDRFVIFASDGLWDQMTNEEAVAFVVNNSREGIAKRLVQRALKVAAAKSGRTYQELQALSIQERRKVHDDITVVVIFLDVLAENARGAIPKVSVRPYMDTEQSMFSRLDDDGAGPSGSSAKDEGAGPSGSSSAQDEGAGSSGTSAKDVGAGSSGTSAKDDGAGASGSSAKDGGAGASGSSARDGGAGASGSSAKDGGAGSSGTSAKDAPPESQPGPDIHQI